MSTKQTASRRPQVFVLTPEERRIVAFILCALALGVATKHYREKHPNPVQQPTAKEHHLAKKVANPKRASPSPAAPDAD
jgi:hypothetical protein